MVDASSAKEFCFRLTEDPAGCQTDLVQDVLGKLHE